MSPEQLGEILQHQTQFFNNLEESLKNELYDSSLIVENFKEKILSNIKWGLLRRDKISSEVKNKIHCTTHWGNNDNELLKIVGNEVLFMENEISSNSDIFQAPLFFPELSQALKDKEIQVFFDSFSFERSTQVLENSEKKFNSKDILNVFQLQLHLPDIEFVFPHCEDMYKIPEWIWEYVDAYEETKYKLEKHHSYLQIGGYGRWIQGSYNNYLAQVNNDVGDAGAVFIHYDKNDFHAHLDMH